MSRSPVSFGRDRGLQARMLLTVALLGLLYTVLVAALLAAGVGAVVMLVLVGGLALAQLFLSDRLVLRSMGAREVSPSEAPELHGLVERLCIQADLPKPRIAIADTDAPNEFALGRSLRSATVCATSGILDLLEPHELEAVMAHELAHVKHRDVLDHDRRELLRERRGDGRSVRIPVRGRDRRPRPGGWGTLLVSVVVYAISFVLMLALSRYRELVAHRGAALTTGRPSAMASALMKLSDGMQRLPDRDLRAAGRMNAFFIVPARVKGTLGSLLSTCGSRRSSTTRSELSEAVVVGNGRSRS